ncbi:MAG: patatin-like phospholipase family protein [Cyanobacteriota bacterium]|nr:patatin-like phospholipase family protein [Cyanobacteriota bacterium]
MERIKAHLVLGAGGVRTLAYVGALERLEEANYDFQSISACSAGALVGAVLATGCSMQTVKQKIKETRLRLLMDQPLLPKPLLFLAGLRWPFAKYDQAGVLTFMRSLIGEGVRFKDLKIPFAMPAIDIASKYLLVFSQTHHPEMTVEEAVQIAIGVFPLYAPRYLPDQGRIVIDAGVATECPVWMVGRFDDDYPIIVLRTTTKTRTAPPQWIGSFLEQMIQASAACKDQHLIDQIPRVREISIDVSDYAVADIDKADRNKDDLFIRGRRAADQFLAKPQWAHWHQSSSQIQSSPEAMAARTASAMMEGFANRLSALSRKKIFISYSHQDGEWMEAIKAALDPYVGSELWDDSQIQPGELWEAGIESALAQTRIALLLVSKNFLSSTYIVTTELAYFLNMAEKYSVQIRWLLLSDISGLDHPLQRFQACHDIKKPLNQLPSAQLVTQLARVGKELASLIDRPFVAPLAE